MVRAHRWRSCGSGHVTNAITALVQQDVRHWKNSHVFFTAKLLSESSVVLTCMACGRPVLLKTMDELQSTQSTDTKCRPTSLALRSDARHDPKEELKGRRYTSLGNWHSTLGGRAGRV